jgi:hypothetical protein
MPTLRRVAGDQDQQLTNGTRNRQNRKPRKTGAPAANISFLSRGSGPRNCVEFRSDNYFEKGYDRVLAPTSYTTRKYFINA